MKRPLLAVGFGLALALAIPISIEGMARLSGAESADELFLAADPYLGFRPAQAGTWNLHGRSYALNSWRLRGPEPTLPKPSGTVRIAFVGDSTVFGQGVDDGQEFPALVGQRLQSDHAGCTVDIINGGMTAWSSAQSLYWLRTEGVQLDPDVLVVGNIWSDSAAAAAPDTETLGRMGLARTGAADRARRTLMHSAAYRSWMRSRGRFWRPAYLDAPDGAPDAAGFYRVPPDEYRANLAEMAALMADRGGQTVFAPLPHPSDMQHGQPMPAEGRYWLQYRQIMADLAAQEGARLVDLPAALGADPDAGFLDPVHPDAGGHANMARTLAASLGDLCGA